MNNQAITRLEEFVRLLLVAQYEISSQPVTEEIVRTAALSQRQATAAIFPVGDEEFEAMIRRIVASYTVKMEMGTCLEDRRNNYKPWYPARIASIDFRYWKRYRKYLLVKKGRGVDVVNEIDNVSDELLGLLGDPLSQEEFSRKGLVLGDVQSGKTCNFTALCNKAADAGYRIVIILAGMIESLRQQTQDRMDLEFSGVSSYDWIFKKSGSSLAGVSDFSGPEPFFACPFTTSSADFSSTVLKSNATSINIIHADAPMFFVVKKNARILKNLLNWLKKDINSDSNDKIHFPTLILDDEADNAAPNTADKDEDPRAINAQIRLLIKMFTKVNYVGVTATPFANIFIDPDTESEMYEDDLFPRDFIYALNPPSDYVGVEEMFGETQTCQSMRVSMEDLEAVLPAKHKATTPFKELAGSLEDAICYFLLCNAVLDCRHSLQKHRSMLIHISHLRTIHKKLDKLVRQCFIDIRNELQNYAALSEEKALEHSWIARLKKVWDEFGLTEVAGVSWFEIQSKYLYKAAAPVKIQVVNTDFKALDYKANEVDGLRVIAIGGNSLSRGLTLEGLMVSYFRRTTKMYDTLLQMGRWFGFRSDYRDLCKVWMPHDVQTEFEEIAIAYDELKDDIYAMQEGHQAPKDFGMKVRSSVSSLLPTARNKMKTAKSITRPITIAGRMLETPRLRTDTLDDNENAVRGFVSELDNSGTYIDSIGKPFWRDVSGALVSDFVRRFETDPWNLNFQGGAIADYIEKYLKNVQWDVAIMTAGRGVASYSLKRADGSELKIVPESRKVVFEGTHTLAISGTKKRVAAGGAVKIGLSDIQLEIVKDAYEKKPTRPGKKKAKNIPDDDYFIEKVRRNPLLMIHPIKPKTEGIELKQPIIFAIGVGIPGDKNKEAFAVYYINLVEWRQANEEISDEED